MLSKRTINKIFEEKLVAVDTAIVNLTVEKKKMIELENKREFEEMMKNSRVKNLKIQAQQNYILNFSLMKKVDLIKALDKRINKEIIFTIPDVMYNNVISYISLEDKLIIKSVSKTMKVRTQSSLSDIEKDILKRPKEYMIRLIRDFMSINTVDPVSLRKLQKLINSICYRFDKYFKFKNPSESKDDIVKIIKHFLNLSEACITKKRKVLISLMLMKFVSGRTYFLTHHKQFTNTVKAKIAEFEEFNDKDFSPNQTIELMLYKEKIYNISD